MRSMPIILFAAAATFATPALAALGTSVNGQGMIEQGRTFAVNARVNADGTATGNATLINRNFSGDSGKGPYQAHFDLTCGKMVDNKTMILGGLATKTNDSNLRDYAYFMVRDNGEPGAGRDEISRAYFWDDLPNTTGDPLACANSNPADFPLEVIKSGNLQVRITP